MTYLGGGHILMPPDLPALCTSPPPLAWEVGMSSCILFSLPSAPLPPLAGTVSGQDVQDFILSGGSNTAPSADTEEGFDAKNSNNNIADIERGGKEREGRREERRE